MKIKSIITISGRISSGKSFAANLIRNEFGLPVATFGGYLKHYCEENNLLTDRKTLQDTGEAFVKENPKQFLVDVISHFIGSADSIVLEGVRHVSILDAVDQLTKNRVSIFIEADLQTRYKRYYERNKDADQIKNFKQFKIADSHPVELDIESLKSISNIILDSRKDYLSILKSKLKPFL